MKDKDEQIRHCLQYQAYMEIYCYKCQMWTVCEASNIEDCMRRDEEHGYHIKRHLLKDKEVKELWQSGERMMENDKTM